MPDLDWYDMVAAGNYERPRHLPGPRCGRCNHRTSATARMYESDWYSQPLCGPCKRTTQMDALWEEQAKAQADHNRSKK